jgi:hypothetical protein
MEKGGTVFVVAILASLGHSPSSFITIAMEPLIERGTRKKQLYV